MQTETEKISSMLVLDIEGEMSNLSKLCKNENNTDISLYQIFSCNLGKYIFKYYW